MNRERKWMDRACSISNWEFDEGWSVMKFFIFLSILAVVPLCAAPAPTTPTPQVKSVPFHPVGGNYFLVTTFPIVHTPTFFVIRNYNDFDSLFHWAGVMGQDTSQFISREKLDSCFVVAVVIQGAYSVTMTIQKITLASGILSVYYTKADSAAHPEYTSNNRAVALVSNCAYTSMRFIENDRLIRKPWIDRR
jgi:hypothetical protein